MIVLGHLLRILADHIRMCFRIPRTSNTKDISAFVANELDQIQRTGEPSLRSDECLLTFRRIPSQCQDVLHAALLQSLQCMFQLFLGHIGAREVHHRFDTDHVLHLLGDVQREIRGRTSGSPGDIAKERSCSHHLVHPHEQVFNSLFCLGREKFEGEELPVLLHGLVDLFDDLQTCSRASIVSTSSWSRGDTSVWFHPSFGFHPTVLFPTFFRSSFHRFAPSLAISYSSKPRPIPPRLRASFLRVQVFLGGGSFPRRLRARPSARSFPPPTCSTSPFHRLRTCLVPSIARATDALRRSPS
mmetsp:Transcript_7997/g.49403  ORF Transcript_7997/g.49403 Transcript_7997/m.49403 type:complete len:300 (+) Transcript_7997:1466-2365(+)